MEDVLIPDILYYTTIEFDNGDIETPHFFIFNSIPEGIVAVREYYKDLYKVITSITMKEMVYVETVLLPEDTQILVPLNDFGIDDEFKDPIIEHNKIQALEDSENETLIAVLPDPQEAETLMCEAYYRGPVMEAENGKEFIQKLLEDPYETSVPIDYVWLYRPTGQSRSVER